MTVTKEKFYIVKPKASENMCTNPSFEVNTTGWTTGGTNTIARGGGSGPRGVYSLKCTYKDNVLLANYPFTAGAAGNYCLSMDVYIPASYSGTQPRFYFTAFTGITNLVFGYPSLSIRDKWQRVTCTATLAAGDLVGNVYVYENGAAPDVNDYIYIDGVQIETGTVATTYFDGDILETIKGVKQYYWAGQAHASKSYRLASTRSGGELIDITTYCKKIDVIGLGIAPTDVNSIDLTDGTKRFQRTNLNSRYFTLAVAFNNTTIGGVQASRNAMINLVKPDLVTYQQPLIIRYQGETDGGVKASEPIDIKCVYVSGLDTALQRDFERANIVFEISGSYLQRAYDSASVLGYQTTVANMANIMQRGADGIWLPLATGLNGYVRAFATHPITGDLYIAGNFTDAGGVADADKICKWNRTAFSAVGASVFTNDIYALAFAPNGDLYIGGNFTNVGDANGDYIVKWDGTAYSSLDTGVSGHVNALIFDNDGNLYLGGDFNSAGGDAGIHKIAMWDGTSFNLVTAAITDPVVAMDFAPNGDLYIGGTFTNVGDANGDYIVMWDGTALHSLSTGLSLTVYALACAPNGDVYIGGDFTNAGDANGDYITRWDGLKFNSLGNGLNSRVRTLMLSDDGNLYVGGLFTKSGLLTFPDRIAIWTGSQWRPVDINVQDVSAYIYAITIHPRTGTLYIGGDWTGTDAISATVTTPNISTATSYPIIQINGPGTIWQIKNYTTGKAIFFDDLTLLAGEVITLDLRPGKISITSTFRGSILPYVLPGSSYDFPLLPGANNVSAYLFGSTSAASGIVMTWKDNYHGIDGASYV